MALADRLAAEKNPAREVKCSVCRILAELPPDDAAPGLVTMLIGQGSWSGLEIL